MTRNVHALIIGAGAYPHLASGASLNRFSLKPLTSPSTSAQAIADWLRTKLSTDVIDAACGHIELLISHPVHRAPTVPVPSMAEVKAACARWMEVCQSEPECLAIFYFCGHGLYRNSHFLLCDDFGDPSEQDEWTRVIDLERFRTQIERSGVNHFIGFADCCAQELFDDREEISGQQLLSATPPYQRTVTNAMYYAAGKGQLASGKNNSISDYSESIIECLSGLAAVNRNGCWQMDTHSLASALVWLTEQKGLDRGELTPPTQDFRGRCLPLFRYEKGRVRTRIEDRDAPRLGASRARISMQRGDQTITSEKTDPKPIVRDVSPGDWLISIESDDGSFSKYVCCVPPVYSGVTRHE